ncbi:hypothetical protein BC831DRAFT_550757 [Entophlyctis helioformis]|nr:hypothetical protein BC831DRAFT_550757 [Entophlyctis helioformis]
MGVGVCAAAFDPFAAFLNIPDDDGGDVAALASNATAATAATLPVSRTTSSAHAPSAHAHAHVPSIGPATPPPSDSDSGSGAGSPPPACASAVGPTPSRVQASTSAAAFTAAISAAISAAAAAAAASAASSVPAAPLPVCLPASPTASNASSSSSSASSSASAPRTPPPALNSAPSQQQQQQQQWSSAPAAPAVPSSGALANVSKPPIPPATPMLPMQLPFTLPLASQPPVQTQEQPLTDLQKHKQRLMKNREAADISRKRKREHMQNLESSFEEINKENTRLRQGFDHQRQLASAPSAGKLMGTIPTPMDDTRPKHDDLRSGSIGAVFMVAMFSFATMFLPGSIFSSPSIDDRARSTSSLVLIPTIGSTMVEPLPESLDRRSLSSARLPTLPAPAELPRIAGPPSSTPLSDSVAAIYSSVSRRSSAADSALMGSNDSAAGSAPASAAPAWVALSLARNDFLGALAAISRMSPPNAVGSLQQLFPQQLSRTRRPRPTLFLPAASRMDAAGDATYPGGVLHLDLEVVAAKWVGATL